MATYSDEIKTPQSLFALRLKGAKLIDLRDEAQCTGLGLDPSMVQNHWQKEWALGMPASTLRLSDAASYWGGWNALSFPQTP